jgi:hypothetical protein
MSPYAVVYGRCVIYANRPVNERNFMAVKTTIVLGFGANLGYF